MMTYKTVIIRTLVFLFIGTIHSQSFLNLDFEYALPNGTPRKWVMEGEGKSISGKLTQKEVFSGRSGFHIKIKEATCFAYTLLELNNAMITSLTFKGQVKGCIKDSLDFKIMIMNPTTQKRIISDPILSTQKWTEFSFETKNLKNWDTALLALVVSGNGSVFLDNFTLKVNEVQIGNGQPDFRSPSAKEIAILNKEAIPVNQIRKLKRYIDNATLVGLGENSHGSASIFKTKLQILKYLITKMNFTVFALEMPVAEANLIDQYIQGKQLSKNQITQNLVYKSWQNKEMLEIIEWLRTYNQTASKKVHFYGFDMQYADKRALDELILYSLQNNKDLYRFLVSFKKDLKKAIKENSNWDLILKKANKINQYLHNSPALMQHYGNLLLQTISSYYKYKGVKSRDWYMSQNLKWLINSLPKDTKIVLSADNTHLTKTGESMGYYLKNTYQNKYLAFGFTYGSGTYSAVQPDGVYKVHASYPGTYEFLFSKCKTPNFYIDIRNTEIAYLKEKNDFRLIGSRPQEHTQFATHDLKAHFDIIVYLATSKHTEFINQ